MKCLSQSHKTDLSPKGWRNVIQYLDPGDTCLAACPFSTPKCRAACLRTAGRFADPGTRAAGQEARTKAYLASPASYKARLVAEVLGSWRWHKARGHGLAVRLNGTSDLDWSGLWDSRFNGVTFYEYTKRPWKVRPRHAQRLAYSISEHPASWDRAHEYLENGQYVAVVVATEADKACILAARSLEAARSKFLAVDGDQHDLFFLHPRGSVLVLKAKGRARRPEAMGFVKTAAEVLANL